MCLFSTKYKCKYFHLILGGYVIQPAKSTCTKTSGFVEFPDNCAKYYDCEDPSSTAGEPKVKECPFPLLFDKKSQKCEHFSVVQCGTRFEPKDACMYLIPCLS